MKQLRHQLWYQAISIHVKIIWSVFIVAKMSQSFEIRAYMFSQHLIDICLEQLD